MQDTHDWLRGDGTFGRLVSNLSSARAPTVALVSLSKKNRHQVGDILEFFSNRVDGFWFSFVYDYQNVEPLALDRAGQQASAREILGLMSRYRIYNTVSFLKRVGTIRTCRPWLLTTVTVDGQEQSGCMVEALETCECGRCELPCHRELSDILEPRFYLDHLRTYIKKPWL
jgi:hypothetical protein